MDAYAPKETEHAPTTRQNRRELLRLVRELDRVEIQCLRARAFHAEATLTLVEWLETLNTFHWCCAYCQEKPFQILSHLVPLPEGGTTVTNCVPACYHCVQCRKRKEEGFPEARTASTSRRLAIPLLKTLEKEQFFTDA